MDEPHREDEWILVSYKKKKKWSDYSLNRIIDDNLSKQYQVDDIDSEHDEYSQLPTPLQYKCKQKFT
jgi:hypothetical protein